MSGKAYSFFRKLADELSIYCKGFLRLYLKDIFAVSEDSEISHVLGRHGVDKKEHIITSSICVNRKREKSYIVVGVLKEEAYYMGN